MPTSDTNKNGSNVSNPLPSTKKTKTTPTSKKPAGKAGPTLYKQPVFDKRMRTLSWPMQGGVNDAAHMDFGSQELRRGVMVWDKPAPYASQPEVNFLFNPTTVTSSYSMDASDVASSLMFRTAGDTAQAAFAMNQSVSISLYFDRTFELWGSYPSGQPSAQTTNIMDPSVYGINVDILAFKQLTGQLLQQYSINANTGGASPSAGGYVPGISQQGVMTMVPTWLLLDGGTQWGLSYYGYISGFNVTVTHFTQFMVPMRGIIDMDFALMMPPASEPDGPTFVDWMYFSELAQDNPAVPSSTAGKAGR